tara:strand:+ start:437 stop:691 length:255 start_codon:yes stop_codon:yes gene_type:complete
MVSWDIYTESFWSGSYEWQNSGNVQEDIHCFDRVDPYLVKDNDLCNIELHIRHDDEFTVLRYSREEFGAEWSIEMCGGCEDAHA